MCLEVGDSYTMEHRDIDQTMVSTSQAGAAWAMWHKECLLGVTPGVLFHMYTCAGMCPGGDSSVGINRRHIVPFLAAPSGGKASLEGVCIGGGSVNAAAWQVWCARSQGGSVCRGAAAPTGSVACIGLWDVCVADSSQVCYWF